MAATRILYVEGNPDGTVGGSFFSLLYLIEQLDRSRFTPVVVFVRSNSIESRFRDAGAEVFVRSGAQPIKLPGRAGRFFSKAANFFIGFVLEPARLALFIRRHRIRLLHLNNSIVRNHTWVIGSIIAGVPCITHERGINPSYSRRSVWLGRRMRAVICVSGAVRNNILAKGVQGIRLEVIHNGLSLDAMRVGRDRDTILHELGCASEARLIGMVGNIKYWKGQLVLVQALARVRRSFPNLVCVFVGDSAEADAEYRHQFESAIAADGLADGVVVTGYRENVADYINAMELLVHASVEPEPFGRVLLEGMALGKPLVASRDGGVLEIVQDGKTGLLFTPGDSEELADCLLVLLGDPDRGEAMGEAGRTRLIKEFGIERNAELTARIYSDVLARN